MIPLDFECREALRETLRGIELLRNQYLPQERHVPSEVPADLETSRANTDCILEHIHLKLVAILNEDETQPPEATAAEPLGSIDSPTCSS